MDFSKARSSHEIEEIEVKHRIDFVFRSKYSTQGLVSGLGSVGKHTSVIFDQYRFVWTDGQPRWLFSIINLMNNP
jgi:hypothetical protein